MTFLVKAAKWTLLLVVSTIALNVRLSWAGHTTTRSAPQQVRPNTDMKDLEAVKTASREVAKLLADRVGCMIHNNGNRNKTDTVQWNVQESLAAYERFVRSKLGNSPEAAAFLKFDRVEWSNLFLQQLQLRSNPSTLDQKSSDELKTRLGDNIASIFDKLGEKREHNATAGNYFSLYKESNIPTVLKQFVNKNKDALNYNCASFDRMDDRWNVPRFKSNGELITQSTETKKDIKHHANQLEELAKQNPASHAAATSSRPIFSPTPSVPMTEQEKATAKRLNRDSHTEDPLGGVLLRERPSFFKRLMGAKQQIAPGVNPNGLMPGVLYIPTAGGGHHAPVSPVFIITHMTAGRSSSPTSAHFTIHRDGTVTQQGPITQQMPAAKCGNHLAIHVEFEAAYNGWARDSRGNKYAHTYEPITPQQMAAGAKVYAYISHAVNIPLTYLGNGQSPDLHDTKGNRVGKFLAVAGKPLTSQRGVVNHREVICSYAEGVHHDDYMDSGQLNQMLALARRQ